MDQVDKLLQFAADRHIEVDNRRLAGKLAMTVKHDSDVYIAIDFDRIETRNRQAAVLAHEIGHVETSSYTDQQGYLDETGKTERKATVWEIKKLLPRDELYVCMDNCDGRLWEVAEEMGITEDLVKQAIEYYQSHIG